MLYHGLSNAILIISWDKIDISITVKLEKKNLIMFTYIGSNSKANDSFESHFKNTLVRVKCCVILRNLRIVGRLY